MQAEQLISNLLKISSKHEHHALLEKHISLLDPEFARRLKNTYYDSWTKEPHKTRNAANALAALTKILPDEEVKALAEWVNGIADLTEGKLEKAVRDLDKSAAIFRKIGREHDAAQTQVAKLIALALTGRYADAIAAGKSALKIFEQFDDQTAAGKIERNMGNIAARQGDEKRAEKYYLSARKRFIALDDRAELTMSDNSLANTYAELNNFFKAEKYYTAALENARRAKMHVTEAEIEASIGNLNIFRGKYADALRFLELSRRRYEELAMPHQTAIADLEIADIYLELNLADDALAIYERIAAEFKALKMRGEEARTRANTGRAAIVSGDAKRARNELKKAARLYEREENKSGAASVKIALANLELTRKNYKNALDLAAEAESFLRGGTNTRLKFAAEFLKGESLANLGKDVDAERVLTTLAAAALKQEQSNIAQISLNSLGKLCLRRNDLSRAERFFKKSLKIIESLRAPLAGEEFRMSFLADKLAPFENLAKIYLRQNKLEKAFAVIEKSRARTLSENLSEDSPKVSSAANAPKLKKRLAVLREELNWFYSRLNRAEDDEYAALLSEAKNREKQISEVLRQIESTRDAEATGKNAAAPNLKNLQRSLGAERALIEFVRFDGTFSAFVVTNKKINFVENFPAEAEIIELLENLHFQFGTLRYGARIGEKYAAELKKRADFYLEKLGEKLFAPLEIFCKNKNLIIVPAAFLHYVPFQALRRKGKYLIESREISYTPGATAWFFLQSKQARKLKTALLIGFADEHAPLVRREIETLQKTFSAAEIFTGERAKVSVIVENAARFDILHLACHGHFRPENPLFSSLHLADGNITVRDICAEIINAELVTLSACETGLSKIFAGDEILGLARGFLVAGASSLVLSLWTVNDEATTELMKNFYANLQRDETVAASLRKAQIDFIERGAHPYFWSPFAVIGK